MDYVYVVTVGEVGTDKGDFHTNECFTKDYGAVLRSAFDCMKEHKADERFVEVDPQESESDIVRQWNNDLFSVWLERLRVR